jgi:hypothetical protein
MKLAIGVLKEAAMQSKKIYTSPRLMEYGNVARLTQGGSPAISSDSGNNNMRDPTKPNVRIPSDINAPRKRR